MYVDTKSHLYYTSAHSYRGHSHSIPFLATSGGRIVDHDDDALLPHDVRPESSEPTPTVRSESLLQGHCEVLIVHGDQTYRLRLTRSGKLILQK